MYKEIKDKLAEIMSEDPGADDAAYCAIWTDGPRNFNGLKTLRGKKGNAVRAIYRRRKAGDDVTLEASIASGKKVRDSAVELLDALMSASEKAADDAGLTLDETGGKIDAECLALLLDGLKEADAELIVDFLGTDEKFDGGGILYQYRLGRDGSVQIFGQEKDASAETRKRTDRFYRDVLENGDPFTLDRLLKHAEESVRGDDSPLYSLFWTAGDDPVTDLAKVKKAGANVARIEFTGEGLTPDDARVAAGPLIRKAAAGIVFGIADLAPGDENKARAKIDDEGLKMLLETYKSRGLVYVMDLLGDADFDKGLELFVFEISRDGLVGIGRVAGDVGPFLRDLATVYKNATEAARKWTPSVIKAKNGRSKK